MTNEQIIKKNFLSKAFHIACRINSLEDIKNDKKHSLTVNYNAKISSNSSGAYNREEHRIMQILALDDKIEAENKKLKAVLSEINTAISSVRDIELKNILFYRYIKCMKMSDIADAMHYDERTVKRKHLAALDAVVLDCKCDTI